MARRELPHLLVTSAPESRKYTAHPGRDDSLPVLRPDPVSHGKRLLAELGEAWNAAPRDAAGATVFLEFSGPPALVVKSLENRQQGLQLLSVHTVGEAKPVTVAAVSVPTHKNAYFADKVRDYVAGPQRGGSRPNNRLVASIEHVRAATLRSFWTDTIAMPTGAVVARWEVWLNAARHVGDEVVARFRAAATAAGIRVSEGALRFLDRAVVLAVGTAAQFETNAAVFEHIAELRLAKETATFFTTLDRKDERDWGADLAGRVSPAGLDAPRVCLLDSGVNRAHPLLAPSLSESDMHSYDRANWGVTDDFGGDAHGTLMAGLALYGDLVEPLTSRHPLPLTHRLESVKIRAAKDPQPEGLWGQITQEGIARVEIAVPFDRRVFSMAISADDGRDEGSPSAWSGALDAKACGVADDSPGRLIVLAAGNLRGHLLGSEYPTRNVGEGLCDPAQAYNVLTVGADTEMVTVDDPTFPSYSALAPHGALSPFSRSAHLWSRGRFPCKPDLVFEGGNLAVGPNGDAAHPYCLKPLTTWADHQTYLFGPAEATSAASAQVSRMAAMLWAQYPELWPETVRALLVHSARWSQQMMHDLPDPARRVRLYGHGRPAIERAMRSAQDALTLVIQREIQPYAGKDSNELHEFTLPWPSQVLEDLGELSVTLRVALSYFIEPDPSQRGEVERYAYASHHLAFELIREDEALDDFRRRINAVDGPRGGRVGEGWTFGSSARNRGSLHVDQWRGDAVALARRNVLAVYPRRGWWRDRQDHDRVNRKVRYAHVLSIETPEDAADVYSAVANSAQVRALGAAVVAATVTR